MNLIPNHYFVASHGANQINNSSQYIYTSHPVAARCEFFSELESQTPELVALFIVEDFNCVSTTRTWPSQLQSQKPHSSHKDDQQLLLDITIEHNLHGFMA